jgi:hypothetical protein
MLRHFASAPTIQPAFTLGMAISDHDAFDMSPPYPSPACGGSERSSEQVGEMKNTRGMIWVG